MQLEENRDTRVEMGIRVSHLFELIGFKITRGRLKLYLSSRVIELFYLFIKISRIT